LGKNERSATIPASGVDARYSKTLSANTVKKYWFGFDKESQDKTIHDMLIAWNYLTAMIIHKLSL
jgi:hypothetical protein